MWREAQRKIRPSEISKGRVYACFPPVSAPFAAPNKSSAD